MSRYIDIEPILGWCDNPEVCEPYGINSVELERKIRQAPSIDIVRCRECRYCKKKRGTFKGEPIIFYRCAENNRDVEADDFCSYGEREGE